MDSKITSFKAIKKCVMEKTNFVLQGGAGCGKTGTLKKTLEFISEELPNQKIACITHTNLAVNEIIERVGNGYTISTIHSFLNSLIKDYKINLHKVIFDIFRLDLVERKELEDYEGDETSQKKQEHKKYKKCYEKFSKRLFTVKKQSSDKVIGKREYDKDPTDYNYKLNQSIEDLNNEMLEIIKKADYRTIKYNETRFDSFKDLTFGHDSLLKVSSLLFSKFPMLGRIVNDKFDFLFIDEYQDTNELIIDIFLNKLPEDSKTTIGLYGDSMQGIYTDGVGDVNDYIVSGKLIKIEKEDNYRCSAQIINFINQLRDDELEQKVAYKIIDGVKETEIDRKGELKLFYAVYGDKKPHARSSPEEKQAYLNYLGKLLELTDNQESNYTKLMLTNKSISGKVGFSNLYEIFDSRYTEVKEEIEKDLIRLQLIDLVELCEAYAGEKVNYNFVLTELKKTGFLLKSTKDKIKVKVAFDKIISGELSAVQALETAFEEHILKKTESYGAYINYKDTLLKELKNNDAFLIFKDTFNSGDNTFTRMVKVNPSISQEEFDELHSLLKKERFYHDLFSSKLPFKEIIKYYRYLNEQTEYITMHKTKGSGIENVLVVLEEYFWNEYNFNLIVDDSESDSTKKSKNMKLFYVACSRAINNLTCVKIVTTEEERALKKSFPGFVKIDVEP